MLMGKLAMFFGCGGVLLRLFVFAELVMMGRLMMMMRGGVVVSGGGVVMLARRMLRGLGHLLVLLPESGKPGTHKPL
jgi:uncharacterized membrane protein YedE/YeeE